DQSAHAFVYHRGKRSVALDLKRREGRELARSNTEKADVVIEAFRPGVMQRLGLDFESLRATNPQLVYLSLSGYGQEGPRKGLPATDAVIQAYSGLMHLNRDREGVPQRISMIIVDVLSGVYAFQAISTALLRRFRFDTGAYIDCSLVQCAYALQSAKIIEDFLQKGVHVPLYAPLGVMPTRDGYLAISVMRDEHFVSLCEAIGRPELARSPLYDTRPKRVERESELISLLRLEFVNRTSAEWCSVLERAGVLHSKVRTYAENLQDDATEVLRNFDWIGQDGLPETVPLARIPGAPDARDRPPGSNHCPHIGEHTVEVLLQAGIEPSRIEQLIAERVVSVPDSNPTARNP
ncbi:MAG: CaiB/BaiF CoA transferase family protein, partial [Lautropia sp.]